VIYVDTNVFLDVINQDPVWFGWSTNALADGRERLVTGPIVCAELVRHAEDAAGLEQLVGEMGARLVPWTLEASFRSGQAFEPYRAAGGTRHAILADLLTGGHAAALGATMLTRDPQRFRTYFPGLELISPEQQA